MITKYARIRLILENTRGRLSHAVHVIRASKYDPGNVADYLATEIKNIECAQSLLVELAQFSDVVAAIDSLEQGIDETLGPRDEITHVLGMARDEIKTAERLYLEEVQG